MLKGIFRDVHQPTICDRPETNKRNINLAFVFPSKILGSTTVDNKQKYSKSSISVYKNDF